jgi:hypothetical protein
MNPEKNHQTRRHNIEELRHQLKYASTVSEREAIRRELDFWLRYR